MSPRIQVTVAPRDAHPEGTDSQRPVVNLLGEHFTCRPAMTPWSLWEMLATPATDLEVVADAFMTFLEEVIVPGDWDRFRHLCSGLGVDELQPVVQHIVDTYTAPTEPPSDPPPSTQIGD